jgi:hypothetical protein
MKNTGYSHSGNSKHLLLLVIHTHSLNAAFFCNLCNFCHFQRINHYDESHEFHVIFVSFATFVSFGFTPPGSSIPIIDAPPPIKTTSPDLSTRVEFRTYTDVQLRDRKCSALSKLIAPARRPSPVRASLHDAWLIPGGGAGRTVATKFHRVVTFKRCDDTHVTQQRSQTW